MYVLHHVHFKVLIFENIFAGPFHGGSARKREGQGRCGDGLPYTGEDSKFEIRNKFKSSNDGMNKTEARFEFSSFSNIGSLFRISSFALRIFSRNAVLFFEARFEAP